MEVKNDRLSQLYESDFYGWTQQQAKLLRSKKWESLDLANLVEEIESLGRRERQELENRLAVLLGHLLKWQFQPLNRSRSWVATIREQRRRIIRLLEENPSLKPYLLEALENGYQDALDLAVRETNLKYQDFPQECSYDVNQLFDFSFFPGETLESDEDLLI
jgi:hypothetical protein